jgi:hypothetical protein
MLKKRKYVLHVWTKQVVFIFSYGKPLLKSISMAARSKVQIPPGRGYLSGCYVLSGKGPCEELITRPEESYRLCCFNVCDLKASIMNRPWPELGISAEMS